MSALQENLVQLLEPAIESLGYELVLLEFVPHSGAALLRLYIDSPGGINLGDCERVSREVAALMDVEDPVATAYQLEVSSPGMDRPLAKPAHFERFRGETARIALLAPHNGRRRYVGIIGTVTDSNVTLDTPEGPVQLEFSEIEKARLVPDYERE